MSAGAYDINFCFPVPEVLESERVKLTPFIPSNHAKPFFSTAKLHPEIFKYLPFGPYETVDDFVDTLIEGRIRKDPGYILFSVFDKTRRTDDTHEAEDVGALAGLVGLINSSPTNLATEIGCIMILPEFQRTHVASNAVGLILHYALDLPVDGGLGLRRAAWQANTLNKASVRLAERMGLRLEAVLRWDRVLPAGKEDAGNKKAGRDGDPSVGRVGRDTAMLGICWDDWENGGREHVDAIMTRVK